MGLMTITFMIIRLRYHLNYQNCKIYLFSINICTQKIYILMLMIYVSVLYSVNIGQNK